MSFKNFTELNVYKESRLLRNLISDFTKKFPSEEKYRLIDQLLRSSRSVTANIAEGHGRFHFQENIQYCRQSRGSLYEILDHMTVALDEEYINQEALHKTKLQVDKCIGLINGYINYLKRRKESA